MFPSCQKVGDPLTGIGVHLQLDEIAVVYLRNNGVDDGDNDGD